MASNKDNGGVNKVMAILVKVDNVDTTDDLKQYLFSYEPLNDKEYELLLKDKDAFLNKQKITVPSCVIPFVDEDSDEESEIIQLKNFSDISSHNRKFELEKDNLSWMRFTQLKSVESDYNQLLDDHQKLKEKLKKLQEEHDKLKTNPQVKERIVYKEDEAITKPLRRELEELKAKAGKAEGVKVELKETPSVQTAESDLIPPVKKGEMCRVRIDGIGRSGDGFARIDSLIIFVPETKVGDIIEIKITNVCKKFAFGEIVEYVKHGSEDMPPTGKAETDTLITTDCTETQPIYKSKQ